MPLFKPYVLGRGLESCAQTVRNDRQGMVSVQCHIYHNCIFVPARIFIVLGIRIMAGLKHCACFSDPPGTSQIEGIIALIGNLVFLTDRRILPLSILKILIKHYIFGSFRRCR